MNAFVWPAIKISVITVIALLTLAASSSLSLTLALCILITCSYQHLVALARPNTIVMPPMDLQCFISSPGIFANYMNITMYDSANHKIILDAWDEAFEFIPKFRYKIKEIAGDLYYEEMSLRELKEKMFVYPKEEEKVLRSQADID